MFLSSSEDAIATMEFIDVLLALLKGFLAVWDTLTWPVYQMLYQPGEIAKKRDMQRARAIRKSADEIVFDNESGRGAETRIEAPEEGDAGMLTAAQWMTTVDTRTGDFLRSRFALEAARGAAAPDVEAEAAE